MSKPGIIAHCLKKLKVLKVFFENVKGNRRKNIGRSSKYGLRLFKSTQRRLDNFNHWTRKTGPGTSQSRVRMANIKVFVYTSYFRGRGHQNTLNRQNTKPNANFIWWLTKLSGQVILDHLGTKSIVSRNLTNFKGSDIQVCIHWSSGKILLKTSEYSPCKSIGEHHQDDY